MNIPVSVRIRAAITAVLIFAVGSAAAQAKDEAQIEILAIRGTTKNAEVSPELKDIAAGLQKSLKLTGLKLEKPAFSGKATTKQPYETALSAGYKSKVTFVERKVNRITIKIEVTRPAPPANQNKNDKGEKKDEKEKKGDKDKKDEKKKDGEKPAGNAAPDVFTTTITLDAGGRQNFEFDYPGGGGDKLILSVSAK